MKRLAAVLAAGALLIIGTALPANAVAVPFDTGRFEFGGIEAGNDGETADSGLVGVCIGTEDCTGVSITATTGEFGVMTTDAEIQATGAICIAEAAAPCGTAGGGMFTGVRFTTLDVITPGVSGNPRPKVTLEVCVWIRAPEDQPTQCVPRINEIIGPISIEIDPVNLGDFVPKDAGV